MESFRYLSRAGFLVAALLRYLDGLNIRKVPKLWYLDNLSSTWLCVESVDRLNIRFFVVALHRYLQAPG